MHIGIFSESFAPVVNGVSISIETLGRELEKRGHRVSYFAPNFPGYQDERSNVYRLRSVRPSSIPDYPIALPGGNRMFDLFCSLRVDLVHTHTPFVVGTAGLGWAEATSVPVVSTNHTLYTEYVHYFHGPSWMWRWLVVAWMRYYYNRCNAVIVPSNATGKILQSYGVKTPWRAIPTGIELNNGHSERFDLRAKYRMMPQDRLLVYVGRIAKEKNLELLLESFKIVSAEEPRARLVIVGGGPYLEELKENAKIKGIGVRTTFTGPLERARLRDVFSQADIFVFPSLTETQGLAVGEAAAEGLPSVAVASGGIPEFVRDGETGYLVGNDAREFSGRVLSLLRDDEQRRSFGAAARAFSGSLSVDAMISKVLEVYETALGRAA
ncbi:MAG: glycosyltransferase [Armatimonadetes bacterium]|nr:glycosyltransferase [Armatimonadota bacterium]